MFLHLDDSMKLVFELKISNLNDVEHVKRVQNLTLNRHKKNMGLKGTYGLYDTPEWWNNILNNVFKTKTISGVITRLYKAGQDNEGVENSFDLILNNGEKCSSGIYLNNKEDIKLFTIGKKVSIFYIYDELKSGDFMDLVVEMAISI